MKDGKGNEWWWKRTWLGVRNTQHNFSTKHHLGVRKPMALAITLHCTHKNTRIWVRLLQTKGGYPGSVGHLLSFLTWGKLGSWAIKWEDGIKGSLPSFLAPVLYWKWGVEWPRPNTCEILVGGLWIANRLNKKSSDSLGIKFLITFIILGEEKPN